MPTASSVLLPDKKEDYLDQYDDIDDEAFTSIQDSYFAPIGEFLTCFSNFENTLNYAIAELISDRSHETGYTILQKITISNKIDLFYRMHLGIENIKPRGDVAKLKILHTEMLNANTFRNYIAHANWQTLDDDGFIRTAIKNDNSDGRIRFIKVKITPKIIEHNIKAVEFLSEKIYDYASNALDF